MEKDIPEITVNYKKSDSYRSYHADGFFGGLTPRGYLYMEPFIDRRVTPKTMVHKIIDGSIDSGTVKESLEGTIREIECGIIMDFETARTLRDWLEGKIKEYDGIKLIKKGK